ncbi:MAG: DegT/DnrJ/EryC1/StrS family aminotransferase [Planctomycetota bacterium]
MTKKLRRDKRLAQDHTIPFHRPCIEASDVERVVQAIRSLWLTTGPVTRELEEALARYLGCGHVVAVSSGTAALQLLYRAAGVGPGDEVIVPALTFVATAEAAVHLGARPVFADVEAESLLMDPATVERAISSRTKAIVPVHYGGHLCDMARLQTIAAGARAAVIEDAAHALSARHGRVRPGLGTLGAALSFYATKELALGEGGAVVTDDEGVATRVRNWSLHGITRASWTRSELGRPPTYDVEEIGYKMNLPDLVAALGVGQVARLDAMRARRESLAQRYDQGLRGVPGIHPASVRPGHTSARHLYVIRVRAAEAGIDREGLRAALASAGIQTSVHFIPVPEMTAMRRLYGTRPEECPMAATAGREVLSLPLYPDLTEDEVDRVILEIRRVVEAHTP